MTKSVSYTYTFVLLPQAAGNVTIGAAEVKVDGSSYRTRPLPIEIVNEGEGSRAQQQQGGSNRADDTQADAQSRIGKDDILLRAVVSRSSVYKNEPVSYTHLVGLAARVGPLAHDRRHAGAHPREAGCGISEKRRRFRPLRQLNSL